MVANTSDNSYNPRHIFVPEHHLLSDDEVERVLKELNVEKDKLPKIREDDPAVLYLKQIHGNEKVQEGCVIKIVRNSNTAGEFIAYRLVIKG